MKEPWLVLKNPKSDNKIVIDEKDGKWIVEFSGGDLDESAQLFVAEVVRQFNKVFTKRLEQYQDISYIGTFRVGEKEFPVRIIGGQRFINGKSVEDFANSLTTKDLTEFLKISLKGV